MYCLFYNYILVNSFISCLSAVVEIKKNKLLHIALYSYIRIAQLHYSHLNTRCSSTALKVQAATSELGSCIRPLANLSV